MTLLTGNHIAGRWQSGAFTEEYRNPTDTSDTIGDYAQASAAQVDETVAAARQAQPLWWAADFQKRHDVPMAIGPELMVRADEIGLLLAREEGKTLPKAKGEVFLAGQFFTCSAAGALRMIGDHAQSVRPGIEIDVRDEPVGVVAVISPSNLPLATPSWKIATALASGNAVVWKLANLTPASAVALTEIITRQDIPPGLFTLAGGPGKDVGQRLVEHGGIDAISVTGSVPVGRGIAAANMTKIQLEMGSRNPMLAMDDADLGLAVTHAANAAFGGTGQKCTAASRLIVHAAVHDEFVERLVKAAEAFRVGHALGEGVQNGPVVSAQQLAANLDYVALGRSEGADLLTAGERLTRETAGSFTAPTIFAATSNAMRINREEMFAPITCVIKVGSPAEALAVANDSEFRLTAGIMTRSPAHASHFRANMRAGCVMVNLPTAGADDHVLIGRRGAFSFGPREQGSYAAEFYTSVKTAHVAAGVPQ